MPKPKILIVTTAKDLSLDLFYSVDSAELIKPLHVFYDSSPHELKDVCKYDFDYLYFRDPFNDETISQKNAQNNTEILLSRYKNAYKVDGISHYRDMLFEDKLVQYRKFSQIMPESIVLKSLNIAGYSSKFIKKRFSARSKGIVFTPRDFPDTAQPQEYIVQPKLSIKKEYRVFMVGPEIVTPLAVKSNKTISRSTKLIGLEKTIDSEVARICKTVYSAVKFDLVGLDIAVTDEGYVLIEVNRSCQFNAYNRITSLNLATLLNNYLLKL